jgi:hypothetical protein
MGVPVRVMLDGGSAQGWPKAGVSAAARRPHGAFPVTGFIGGVPQGAAA